MATALASAQEGLLALDAYERMAPFYDRFTADYEYERWLACVEGLALAHGMAGRRHLDVGCGTGKSFMPLLERGYRVTACDLSPAMVEIARARLPEDSDAQVLVADMRALPELGEFDLVTCMDDAINYLLDDDELIAAFSCVARQLAPTGVYVFDTNSLGIYQHAFASEFAREDERTFFVWRGESQGGCAPGDIRTATIEIFAQTGDGHWTRRSSQHVQRHHGIAAVRSALAAAGLECVQVLGQTGGAQLHPHADEQAHNKILYVARHRRLPGA